MRTFAAALGVFLALMGMLSFAHGEKTAERFIPLGQSPGLSNKLTDIGEIQSADPGARTISVKTAGGSRTVAISGATRIWVDRSHLRLTNLKGGFADLRAGRKIEVKYIDPSRKRTADWIKVR